MSNLEVNPSRKLPEPISRVQVDPADRIGNPSRTASQTGVHMNLKEILSNALRNFFFYLGIATMIAALISVALFTIHAKDNAACSPTAKPAESLTRPYSEPPYPCETAPKYANSNDADPNAPIYKAPEGLRSPITVPHPVVPQPAPQSDTQSELGAIVKNWI